MFEIVLKVFFKKYFLTELVDKNAVEIGDRRWKTKYRQCIGTCLLQIPNNQFDYELTDRNTNSGDSRYFILNKKGELILSESVFNTNIPNDLLLVSVSIVLLKHYTRYVYLVCILPYLVNLGNKILQSFYMLSCLLYH